MHVYDSCNTYHFLYLGFLTTKTLLCYPFEGDSGRQLHTYLYISTFTYISTEYMTK
jgi:hypothetical protein